MGSGIWISLSCAEFMLGWASAEIMSGWASAEVMSVWASAEVFSCGPTPHLHFFHSLLISPISGFLYDFVP